MTKVAAAFFMACALFLGAQSAYAQSTPQLTLTLFRAVRISDTSLSLSFKSSQSALGEVIYTEPNGSKVQLTDSAPQTDHLFTMTELSAAHGYTFTITASAGSTASNKYVVLLSPDSIGGSGQSIVPSVQVVTATGDLLSTTVAASTTPVVQKTYLPWWAFALLFILFVGGLIAKKFKQKLHSSPDMPSSPTAL